uniref:Uncharacterized protein n=1 Tax=Ditylenchus dipsaci TaxID=166011 RepID=A0A915CSN8_9BILA
MEENEAGLIQDRILKRMREFCELCGGTVVSLNHVVNWRGNAWINAPIITKRIILTRSETDGSLYAQLNSKDPKKSRRVPYAITSRGLCAVEVEELSVAGENNCISD